MSEPYVYTTTSELWTAWGENEQKRTAFIRSVVEPWDTAHPDAKIAWATDPGGADQIPLGFVDSGQPLPVGLSRAQTRRYLIPARGKAGQPYRDALEQMKGLPTRTTVFRRFGIETRTLGGGLGDGRARWCMTQAARLDGVLFVISHGSPLSSPHLVTAKLSEFHAAKERQTEIEALAADTRAVREVSR